MKKYVLSAIVATLFVSGNLWANTVDLTGTWSGDCVATGEMDTTMRLNFSFNDAAGKPGSAITNLNVFADAECKVLVKKTNFVANYTLGEEFGEGTAFDMAVTTALETSLHDEVTKMLNAQKHCGYSDWLTGITKIVNLATCGQQLPFAWNQTLYTIIKVADEDGTSKLLFGDRSGDDNGTSADKRPKVIDARRQYTKR